jgi:hypothetical protein
MYWQNRGVIEWCEVRFPGCQGRYGLSPAHSLDRDEIQTRDEFFEVVAACNVCHKVLDHKMSKEARLAKVKEVIEQRESQYTTA